MPDRLRPGSTTTTLLLCANQDGSAKLTTGKENKRTIRANSNLKLLESIITVGIWNVCTLRRCGKLEELTNELNRYIYIYIWYTIGIVETRMTGRFLQEN